MCVLNLGGSYPSTLVPKRFLPEVFFSLDPWFESSVFFFRHLDDGRAVAKELVFLGHGLFCDWRHRGRHKMGGTAGGPAKRDFCRRFATRQKIAFDGSLRHKTFHDIPLFLCDP